MTPQSKAEALRLAISDAAFHEADRLREIYGETHYRNTLARYIEGNPAISGEVKAEARELAHWLDTKILNLALIAKAERAAEILRQIAGPEEVDPLLLEARKIAHAHCASTKHPKADQVLEGKLDDDPHFGVPLTLQSLRRGMELATPITKQEGDHA